MVLAKRKAVQNQHWGDTRNYRILPIAADGRTMNRRTKPMTLLCYPVLEDCRQIVLKEKTRRSPDVVAAAELTIFLNEFVSPEFVKFKVNPCVTLQSLCDQVMTNQRWGTDYDVCPVDGETVLEPIGAMVRLSNASLREYQAFVLKPIRSKSIIGARERINATVFLNEVGSSEFVKFGVRPTRTLRSLVKGIVEVQHWGDANKFDVFQVLGHGVLEGPLDLALALASKKRLVLVPSGKRFISTLYFLSDVSAHECLEIEGRARQFYGSYLFFCDRFGSELVIEIPKNVEPLKTNHRFSSLDLKVDLEDERNCLYVYDWADERAAEILIPKFPDSRLVSFDFGVAMIQFADGISKCRFEAIVNHCSYGRPKLGMANQWDEVPILICQSLPDDFDWKEFETTPTSCQCVGDGVAATFPTSEIAWDVLGVLLCENQFEVTHFTDQEHLMTSEMSRMMVMNMIGTLAFKELFECFQAYGRIKDIRRYEDGTRCMIEYYETAQRDSAIEFIPLDYPGLTTRTWTDDR
jgi:hypothetical protein